MDDLSVSTIVKLDTTITVTSETPNNAVVLESPEILTVVSGGSQGPPGIPGSAFTYEVAVAGTTLGGHRMVTTNASGKLIYADSSISGHANKVMGMITNATTLDELVNVYTTGTITEMSWSWNIDEPLYLSTNGQLTQTPPTTGFLLIVGFPVTSTKIFIDLVSPIILA